MIPDRVRNDEGEGRGDGRSFAATKWDRALVRYRRAEAALAAGAGADDELFGRLIGRLNKALGRLLRTPAPDLPALAAKLDLLVAHEVWELNFAEPSLAAMRRDAHRLARYPICFTRRREEGREALQRHRHVECARWGRAFGR